MVEIIQTRNGELWQRNGNGWKLIPASAAVRLAIQRLACDVYEAAA